MESVSVSIPKLASLDTLELDYDKDNVEPLIKSECYVKRSSKSNSSVGDSFGECKGVVVLMYQAVRHDGKATLRAR